MSRNGLLVCLLAAVLAAPATTAGSAPSLVFLADGEGGLLTDGVLTQSWPDNNESKARPVLLELSGPSTVFVDMEAPPGTHLRGPVFAGIWPDAGLAMDARLKVTLYVDDVVINHSLVVVNLDPSNAPDPASLVPPDPTDPHGAVYHAIAQVAPLVLQPPTLVDLGTIDVEVPEGSQVRIGFGIVGNGSVPVAAAMALKYDGILSPSFVYLPWWSADPAAVSPQIAQAQSSQTATGGPSGTSSGTDGPPVDSPGEDSPGLGLMALLVAVAAALLLRRR